jgi:hypothetical protein
MPISTGLNYIKKLKKILFKNVIPDGYHWKMEKKGEEVLQNLRWLLLLVEMS